MLGGSVAVRAPAPSWNGATVSRRSANVGIAGGAGVQMAADWQLWLAAPATVMLVVVIWPCSGISHPCLAGRFARPRQTRVPNTGWSWNRSKSAASTAFISGRLSEMDVVSKGMCAPIEGTSPSGKRFGVAQLRWVDVADGGARDPD